MVPPSFGPGSGWYRPGPWSPYSHTDLIERAKAAWPCHVVRLRSAGKRMRAWKLLERGFLSGNLVCEWIGPERWSLTLYEDQQAQARVFDGGQPMVVIEAELIRQNDGVRLYCGIEVGTKQPQSWLCSADPDQLSRILTTMLQAEGTP
jgi:hypothetical protein